MLYAEKGKELREETPLGIESAEQWRHFLEGRRGKGAEEKGTGVWVSEAERRWRRGKQCKERRRRVGGGLC